MKKKIFIVLLFIVTFITELGVMKANASTEAELRGYKVSDFWNLSEPAYNKTTQLKVNGTYYGTIWTWAELYKYWLPKQNEMYILILCTARMQPSQDAKNIFNNQKMSITLHPSWSGGREVVDWFPKATDNGTITNSSSISATFGASTLDLHAEFTRTVEESTSVSDVTVYNVLKEPLFIDLQIDHNFVNYANSKDYNINRSIVSYSHMAIYKLSDYDIDEEPFISFQIEHKSSFYYKNKKTSKEIINSYNWSIWP